MILCADDYGLSDDINRAILELVRARKLSAVSCMVLFEQCSQVEMTELLKHQSNVDVGLHLCLTDEGLPTSRLKTGGGRPAPQLFPSFGALVKDALRKRVRSREITAEVELQYKLFVEKTGQQPDFIDGHLHVHQLPGVREGLLDFVRNLPAKRRPYVRNTCMPMAGIWRRRLPWLKTAFIGWFGARMRKDLEKAAIDTNDEFAGIYDFRDWQKYRAYLPRFVDYLRRPNGILVVHPGKNEEWRRQEFATLGEFAFPQGMPNRFQR
jgi:predicted glycoside hydrolase/deacetylase ChbG (UPF0249 family)